MPLTAKGEELKRALTKEYGAKNGDQVLYAGKNSGKFTGIDSDSNSKIYAIFTACDSWEESKHPRDNSGQFGSGSGGAGSKSASSPSSKSTVTSAAPTGKSKAPFVNDFMKEHKSREQDLSRLSSLSDEKLNKALALIEKHNVNDEDAKYMKGLIRETLKSGPKSPAASKPPASTPKATSKSDPTTEGFMRTTWNRS